MAAQRFVVNKVKDEVALDLAKKLLQAPALGPYIVAQIAGQANIKVAVPGILSGSVAGFGPRTGQTRRTGLRAVFKNQKTGFQATLWTPLFNIFTTGTKRGIKPLPLWESFDAAFQASGIGAQVVEKALDDFENNRIPDLNKYLLLGTQRGGRKLFQAAKLGLKVEGVKGGSMADWLAGSYK
jgi:hypothetical protein